jgi:hypothetical protein
MRKRKNPNKSMNREKYVNELMGHWGHISEISDRTSVSDLDNKNDNTPSLFLPIQRVFAKTVALDLVEVKPMSAPNGMLHYFNTDIVYTDEEQIDMDAEKWMRKNVEWTIIKTNQIKQ